jgi:hypothetical protein
VFGEGGLFPVELGPLRLESAKALSFVSALVLTAASMREIEAEYPVVRYIYRFSVLPNSRCARLPSSSPDRFFPELGPAVQSASVFAESAYISIIVYLKKNINAISSYISV